ncbi:hypothetical protein NX786_10510 [Telluria mixta]|uniref:Glycosyltransferase RgtA/B/C/D-like domain-containing protein n=1 Tax=Telluria mixta TaxID=34071 RepID=A0ABT2BYU6_9BURK|nr:hypothetical protein [Telluria mixta]MCS0629761.1 hypothetical protein [Telluria mixta]WEM96673.1 hypothetical protein P0M04_02695 [Telluria mixta]
MNRPSSFVADDRKPLLNARTLSPNVLLFVAIAIVLMVFQWHIDANKVLHEMGDFGANSLLILDAKRLHLLYGNYSRIGVNHPGPAILYVLAFGELVFHDWLHVAPSPFSGQLLAVCLYSAAWIVTVFALVRRMVGAVLPALMFTLVFTAVLGLCEPSVFLGIWFPDLYILPFAVVVLSIARLAWGHTDALRTLAVSSGFVINGHVSFVPMLGVMLIVMLAANLLVTLRDPERRILAPGFLVRHRRDILISVGILFLFFVPLIIATIVDFPGPVYGYIAFGRNDKHNALAEALAFVGLFWKPGHAWIWGVAVALLLLTGVRAASKTFLRDARALGFAFVAASAALLFYAKFGIDHLDLVYVGLFYYSVPALAAGLGLLYLYEAVRWNAKVIAAGIVTVAAVVATGNAVKKPAFYDDLYDIPGSAQLYDQLRKLPGTGRIVLDIEQNGIAWEYVWGNVVALQLHARRQGEDLFCMNEHWHILFTKPARCRPEELNTQRRFFVRPTRTADMVAEEPDFQGQGLLLYRHGRVLTPVAYTNLVDHKDYFRTILGKGWADIETDFVWSTGPVAEINLPADPKRQGQVHLDLGSFMPVKTFSQHVDVLVNGQPAGGWDFNNFEMRRQIKIPLGADPTAPQHIELRIAHPVSPKQYGWSPDDRLLGVSLYGIR